MSYSRRNFLKHSIAATSGTILSTTLPSYSFAYHKNTVPPSDRLRLGVIGCNGMGWSNMRSHLLMEEVECVAICDVDQSVRETRAKEIEEKYQSKPALYNDYRKLLEDPNIDAVIIGTPDHWHCLNMVDAVAAGKHVYVEKPLANSIQECRIMMAAAKKYGKIVQVGQWQRSGSHYQTAIEFVQSGKLGNIRLVKVWAYQGWMKPVPVKEDSVPPEGVDYAMWLGPAPKKSFNPNRFHFNFRWFWDYAGGLMTDWGVHEIDIALYAMKALAPRSVMAIGGKLAYPDDASETPDTLQAVYEYDGFNMLWEHATGIDGGNYGRTEGIAFIGNNGTLVLNRQGWEVISEEKDQDGKKKKLIENPPSGKRKGNYLNAHTQNFIDAVKNADASTLTCGIESGSIAAINAHMGNIAFKTGRKIHWDEKEQRFIDDTEANTLLTASYHNEWKLPKA